MKKSTVLLFIMAFALLVISGCDKKKEPNGQSQDSTEVDPQPQPGPDPAPDPTPKKTLSLSKTSFAFNAIGQTEQLKVTVTPESETVPTVAWKSSNTAVATVSDNGLVTCTGFGQTTITATADGMSATCSVYVDDGTVTDICGNIYNYITIGNQMWMAENMRCNKYDTESERAGAAVSTSSTVEIDPYYSDCRFVDVYYADNLTPIQRAKLGYLYNWAAAVGLDNEDNARGQVAPFESNRQGICPNGWHVPTVEDWDALGVAIGGIKDSDGFPDVGDMLKTTSGWYSDGNGTDDYSFSALPAGEAYGSDAEAVGADAFFWTSTPYNDLNAYVYKLYFDEDYLYIDYEGKEYAYSVRCVRN